MISNEKFINTNFGCLEYYNFDGNFVFILLDLENL
jgi:hypothetical protein